MKCWNCDGDFVTLLVVNVRDPSTTPGTMQRTVCQACKDEIESEARKERVRNAYQGFKYDAAAAPKRHR